MKESWHTVSAAEAFCRLETSAEGLSVQGAKERLERDGYNELVQKAGKSLLQMFIEQIKDFMIIVLLTAAGISALLGEVLDAFVILLIIIINAVIGVVQEKKAENSLEALKKMSAPSAKVMRDGRILSIPAREVVKGDVVILEAGDMVSADMRLIECINLKIQESALTGESVPVEKDCSVLLKEDTALGDRINMAYSGSVVTYGRGKGVVVETAMDTEVGAIAQMLSQQSTRQTPLQQKLEALGKTLAIAALAICALIFVVGTLYGKDVFDMFFTAVSLAVAAIPEGLPAIATIVLALSVTNMVKRNAIVRTLPSVETLGSATVICSDKTGTLTQNKMEVTHFYADGRIFEAGKIREIKSNALRKLIDDCALCNDARYVTNEGSITAVGDPTEIALIDIAKRLGTNKADIESKMPRVSEIPFDSERKLMTTVHDDDGKLIVFVKGAVDILLTRCQNILIDNSTRAISDEDIRAIQKANDEMAQRALRVLGMAYKEIDRLPEKDDMASLEQGLTFIGMTGMIDPPREEARNAVAVCRNAGIHTVMITGDHITTAIAIAKDLDILREDSLAITGRELDAMSDEEFESKFEKITVYARISPEHKVRIVKAWQKKGNIVAMTGDGVNDAPALKNADIGAAMGIVGTEVAKEAADIILTDDNFATVVSAVEEGRRVYDNILKTIQFLLSCNIGEILTLFIATLFNWDEPLLPVHLLWVNLVTDSLPALGLGVDPAIKGIMNRKATVSKSVFSPGIIWRLIYQGIVIGGLTLTGFIIGHEQSVEVGRTMAFCVLAFSQLVHSYSVRSATYSAFSKELRINKYLIGATVISAALMFLVLVIPPMEAIFKLVDLSLRQWLWVAGLSVAPLVIVEIMKLLKLNDIANHKN